MQRFSRPSLEKPKPGKNNDIAESEIAAHKPAYKQNSKTDYIDTSKLPPELAEIIVIWPQLPSNIRWAIVAITKQLTKKIK